MREDTRLGQPSEIRLEIVAAIWYAMALRQRCTPGLSDRRVAVTPVVTSANSQREFHREELGNRHTGNEPIMDRTEVEEFQFNLASPGMLDFTQWKLPQIRDIVKNDF